MTAFVDTNILVRHLTGDPPAMARRATATLTNEPQSYLAACAERSGVGVVASVDKAIDRVATISRIEP